VAIQDYLISNTELNITDKQKEDTQRIVNELSDTTTVSANGGTQYDIAKMELLSILFVNPFLEMADDPVFLMEVIVRGLLTGVLYSLVALGLLMGGRDMLNIWRNVSPLSQAHRRSIGLRVINKESGLLKMPGYDALNDLFNKIDPHAYARALTAWLQQNTGTIPRSLALDGKSIGDGKCGMIVTLCRHEDGRPVAMIPATGAKEDSEVSEGRTLLGSPEVNLAGAIVTLDPLHNKSGTMRTIVQQGGDYIVGTKDNTSNRLEAAQRALQDTPFLT